MPVYPPSLGEKPEHPDGRGVAQLIREHEKRLLRLDARRRCVQREIAALRELQRSGPRMAKASNPVTRQR